MKWLILIAIALPAFAQIESEDDFRAVDPQAKAHGKARAKELGREIDAKGLLELADRSDWMIEKLVEIGIQEMKKANRSEEAERWAAEYYFHYRGFVGIQARSNSRNIGDFAPINEWIDAFYFSIEILIGRAACKSLHLDILFVANHALNIVFRPCAVDRENYRYHFSGDLTHDGFFGLASQVTFFAVDIVCMAGTAGLATMLCGPAASVAEWAGWKWVWPGVSYRIYDRACNH